MQTQNKVDVAIGDIVQITAEDHAWFGSLLIVAEVKSWGVRAFIVIPKRNDRREVSEEHNQLLWGLFEVVGRAVMVPENVGADMNDEDDFIMYRERETH